MEINLIDLIVDEKYHDIEKGYHDRESRIQSLYHTFAYKLLQNVSDIPAEHNIVQTLGLDFNTARKVSKVFSLVLADTPTMELIGRSDLDDKRILIFPEIAYRFDMDLVANFPEVQNVAAAHTYSHAADHALLVIHFIGKEFEGRKRRKLESEWIDRAINAKEKSIELLSQGSSPESQIDIYQREMYFTDSLFVLLFTQFGQHYLDEDTERIERYSALWLQPGYEIDLENIATIVSLFGKSITDAMTHRISRQGINRGQYGAAQFADDLVIREQSYLTKKSTKEGQNFIEVVLVIQDILNMTIERINNYLNAIVELDGNERKKLYVAHRSCLMTLSRLIPAVEFRALGAKGKQQDQFNIIIDGMAAAMPSYINDAFGSQIYGEDKIDLLSELPKLSSTRDDMQNLITEISSLTDMEGDFSSSKGVLEAINTVLTEYDQTQSRRQRLKKKRRRV